MRVLYIITRGDTLGGAQVHVALMAARMREEGHEVLVVYGGEPAAFFNTLEEHRLQSISIPELQNRFSLLVDIRVMAKINRIIKQFVPDILSLHSTKAGLLFRFNGFLRKVPVVITVHGWAFTDGVSRLKKVVLSAVEKMGSPFVNRYILVSEYDYHLALRYHIAPSRKFYVIHNGIPEIAPITAGTKGIDNDLSIIMVARFDNQKDQQLLLDACRTHQAVTIHFVGDGPKQPEIEQRYRSGGFTCKAVFWGLQYNVREHLAKADVFALVSNWEGFPLSTLEAMSLGLPVIVSDVGGAAECVRDGINGFVIPRGNKDVLEAKIRFCLEHKTELQRMGEASLQIFRESFTADIMYKKTIAYFNELLNR
jgi:glycosyltransferase involved in cell wall biosynthesis